MASSSLRALGPSRSLSRLTPPRSCPPDGGASPDTTHIPVPAPDSLLSRLEVVDSDAARRKFALYGHQHAHVDHLTSVDQDTAIVLQSTMLLQEDGLLAARLDDVTYLLDGLLRPVTTRTGCLAQARSILELAQLLQDPQILQAVELSSHRRRVKELLLSKLGETEEEMLRVSLAVLVYFLSGSPGAEEYFDDKVLDAVVHALKQELVKRETMEKKRAAVADAAAQRAAPLKKTCLKRKNTGRLKKMEAATEVNEMSKTDILAVDDQGVGTGSFLATSTTQVLDDLFQMRLDELLQDNESFYADEELQISVVGTLCAALHNLLRVDGSSSSASNSSSGSTQRYQQQRSARPGGTAGDTFQTIRARKRQLMQNGGLNLLAYDLAQQLTRLEALLPSTQAEEVTVDCARSLHRIGMLLCVFDQVTFLTLDVQHYISKRRSFFALLLKISRLLSELSWSMQEWKRWKDEPSRMSLAVEVLLSTLRVLINLTHHNSEAANHVQALGGMQLLADAFSQLCGVVKIVKKHPLQLLAQRKWGFDSCLLLLSVMVNSIEFSEGNRDALVGASVWQVEARRGAAKALETRLGACELFTRFFVAKLQSYKHLLDVTETQESSGAISTEEEGDDWNPEDVILGGCTSLLLGYLMKGSSANRAAILRSMPDSSPRLLLRALGVFVAFHSQIGALTPEVAKSVLVVEKVLKSCQERGIGTDNEDSLETVAAKASRGLGERHQIDTSSAAKSEERDPDLCSTIEGSEYCDVSLPTRRARSLRNVCSNLDGSDEDTGPHVQGQEEESKTKGGLSGRNSQASGIRTPTRTAPRSPGRNRYQDNSVLKLPSVAYTNGKSSVRASRYSPIAILPDGSLSSPVVARLLKRTRQLVEEFDAEFVKVSHSAAVKESGDSNERGTTATDKSISPSIVFTMDVTCCDNGSEGLNLSQDTGEEKCTNVGTNGVAIDQDVQVAMPSKRRKKPRRDPGGSVRNAVVYLNTPPLQTPTRTGRSPEMYRESPLLILTATKPSPLMPMRMKKFSGLLRTPEQKDQLAIAKPSPMSASPHRRKAKVVRALASNCTSSVFDFTD